MSVPCYISCELWQDNDGCDISCYCENNKKYYCCNKDKCFPDKNIYPDVDCRYYTGEEDLKK